MSSALLALTFVMRRMSKYGGQTLAVLEVVAQELKLYSLAKTSSAEGDKSKPVFEEN